MENIDEFLRNEFFQLAHEKHGKTEKAENKALEEALRDWIEKEKENNIHSELIDVLLNSDSSSKRQKAAGSLGKYNDDKTLRALLKSLKTDDTLLRRKVTNSLGKIGNERAIKQLITLLDDEDNIVRGNAERYLGYIGEPAVKQLIESIKSYNPNIKAGSITALGTLLSENNYANALDIISDALKDENDMVNRRSADVLKSVGIGTPHAIRALIYCLNNSSITVKLKVLETLGEIGDKESIYYIMKAKNDDDERVRKTAMEAWKRIKERVEENKI